MVTYPTDRKSSCTGQAKHIKCKVGCGAMANMMPLSVFERLNLSEFDKDGIPFQGLTGTWLDCQHMVIDQHTSME